MATVKGMGPCSIPGENNFPCGRQIAEGEPVGTITMGNVFNPQSAIGHRHCADAWWERKRSAEREQNFAMVKRVNQSQAGGAVNFNEAYDAVQGSVPLEKKDTVPLSPTERTGTTIKGDLSQGAHFIGDLPEDATPDQAVQYATGGGTTQEQQAPDFSQYKPPGVPLLPHPAPQLAQDFPPSTPRSTLVEGQSQLGFAPPQAFYNAPLTEMLPQVDAADGKVIVTLGHLQAQVDVEDAEDFCQILGIQINRARRQQGA